MKRKITSYFRSSKRQRTAAPSKRATNVRRRAPKNRRKSRVAVRRKPKRKFQSKKNLGSTKVGNVKTYCQEVAGVSTVPRPGTGTAADLIGQLCTYFGPGFDDVGYISYTLGGWYHLEAIANILRNAEIDGGSSNLCGETKFAISGRQQYQLVNQSNSVATVNVYHCRVRRDIASTQSFIDPRNLIGDGFWQRQFGSVRGASNAAVNDALLTPFDSHKFTSEIQILNQSTIKIDPGMNFSKTITMSNHVINWNHYVTFTGSTPGSTYSQDYAHLKGEQFLMFRVLGQPADYNNANATFTSPKLDYICKSHYNFYSIDRQMPIIYKGPTIGFLQAAAGAQPTIMVDESGVASSAANA